MSLLKNLVLLAIMTNLTLNGKIFVFDDVNDFKKFLVDSPSRSMTPQKLGKVAGTSKDRNHLGGTWTFVKDLFDFDSDVEYCIKAFKPEVVLKMGFRGDIHHDKSPDCSKSTRFKLEFMIMNPDYIETLLVGGLMGKALQPVNEYGNSLPVEAKNLNVSDPLQHWSITKAKIPHYYDSPIYPKSMFEGYFNVKNMRSNGFLEVNELDNTVWIQHETGEAGQLFRFYKLG